MARKHWVQDGIVYVPLTSGYVAKLDLCDEPLTERLWLAGRAKVTDAPYARRRDTVAKKWVHLHREVMKRSGRDVEGFDVDHINHDRLDCRRQNLRLANRSATCRNRLKQDWQTYKGIFLRRKTNRWIAQITLATGKRKHLGCFLKAEDAAKAYDVAAIERFGEFACTNGLA